jgi:hypothetical protein
MCQETGPDLPEHRWGETLRRAVPPLHERNFVHDDIRVREDSHPPRVRFMKRKNHHRTDANRGREPSRWVSDVAAASFKSVGRCCCTAHLFRCASDKRNGRSGLRGTTTLPAWFMENLTLSRSHALTLSSTHALAAPLVHANPSLHRKVLNFHFHSFTHAKSCSPRCSPQQ